MNLKWVGILLLAFGFLQAAALYTLFPLPQLLNVVLVFVGTFLWLRHKSR